ncbi:nucleotide-diphospho-sugar transferase [Amanita rubescens]|nr:nucleotide-diphospho-sugar transferase [Amanita rubescens]
MDPSSVHGMFQEIMLAVQQSNAEIAELRQECSELRLANVSLERQVRDSMQNHSFIRNGTPGFMTPSPPSPQLRAKLSPFLNHSIPTLAVPTPEPFYKPSPLGYNALTTILTLNGRSLIQATWDRLIPLSTPARTTVVAGPSHVKSIRDQIPDLLSNNLFCEPGPKDSMAAIGLAAAILAKRDPHAVIGSFAADHMISGNDAFLAAVAEAVEVARKDYLVTIGIAPSHPSTGFGYIRLGDSLGLKEAPNARLVSSFKEKPDARTAASYIATGTYRWNAGMFVTKAAFLLQLLKEYKPTLYEGLQKIADVWEDETARQSVLSEVWSKLEKIPIDNAVAEPAAAEGRVAVVPATFGWDDVGDFSSLADLLPAEANQPRILGDNGLVLTEQVAGGIVVPGSGRLIACLGVDDLVIVDMPDTLLVTTRARSQEVKRLVKKCSEAGWKQLL